MSGEQTDSSTPLIREYDRSEIENGEPVKVVDEGEKSSSRFALSKNCKIGLVSVFIILAVMLPVTFLVILPSMVQGIVNDTAMTVDTVYMLTPSNDSFTSQVVMKFSKAPPLPATMKLNKVLVSCDELEMYDYLSFTHSNTLHVTTDTVTLTSFANVEDEEGLRAFTEHALQSKTFTWHLKGTATVTALGDPVITHIDKVIELNGFDGFATGAPDVTSLSVTGGTAETLSLLTKTVLNIDSNIVMSYGQNMNFNLVSNGVMVGVGTIPDCVMQRGAHEYTVTIAMTPSNDAELHEVENILGNYIAGVDTSVLMQGFFLDNSIPWMDPGLASISMNAALPSISEKLIQRIDMGPVNLLHLVNVDFTLEMYNAVESVLTITALQAMIYFEGKHIGTVDESGLNIIVQPMSAATSSKLTARTDLKSVGPLTDLLKAGEGLLDIVSTVTLRIGDFPVSVPYNQNQVPAFIT
jgi:hypothetical protein